MITTWFRRLFCILTGRPIADMPLGARGEKAAAQYLKRHGYRLVARNFRFGKGEIDLIMRSRDQKLVFIEVKTRGQATSEEGLMAVDQAKKRKLTQTALAFLKRHKLLGCPIRFDVVSVCYATPAADPEFTHITSAFEATGVDSMFS